MKSLVRLQTSLLTLPLPELFSSLWKAVESWGGGGLEDDVCLLGVELAEILNPAGISVHGASGI